MVHSSVWLYSSTDKSNNWQLIILYIVKESSGEPETRINKH